MKKVLFCITLLSVLVILFGCEQEEPKENPTVEVVPQQVEYQHGISPPDFITFNDSKGNYQSIQVIETNQDDDGWYAVVRQSDGQTFPERVRFDQIWDIIKVG